VFVEGLEVSGGLLEPMQPCLDSSVAVMLHQRDDRIAEPAQLIGLAAVAALVVGDFLTPPLSIALRFDVAAWAAVPKAAVDEDGDVVVRENYVGSPGQTCGSRRVSDTHLPHDSAHAQLGFRPSRRDSTHPRRYFRGWLEWSELTRHFNKDILLGSPRWAARTWQLWGLTYIGGINGQVWSRLSRRFEDTCTSLC